jgi:hypothetical protein
LSIARSLPASLDVPLHSVLGGKLFFELLPSRDPASKQASGETKQIQTTLRNEKEKTNKKEHQRVEQPVFIVRNQPLLQLGRGERKKSVATMRIKSQDRVRM